MKRKKYSHHGLIYTRFFPAKGTVFSFLYTIAPLLHKVTKLLVEQIEFPAGKFNRLLFIIDKQTDQQLFEIHCRNDGRLATLPLFFPPTFFLFTSEN